MGYVNLEVEVQQGENLCWAAVAASISKYYNPASFWTQCAVAGKVLNFPECCTSIDPCNRDYYLETALQTTSNLASPATGQLTIEQIRNEIDQQRPIGIRIGFELVGHFVVLIGYDDSQGSVTLTDPTGADHTLYYASFTQPGGYPGGGWWTYSYLTKA